MSENLVSCVIPFAGFYNSIHDAQLDWACEFILQDDSGNCVHDALPERLFDSIEWARVHVDYARQYALEWADAAGIKGLEFEELNSPREYNFTTDRIFVKIPANEIARIRREIDPETLAQTARDWFTSRSGFISFYSPDVESWGDVESWDHNQIGCMLEAWQTMREGSDFEESRICDDWSGNGMLENWILNTPKAIRVANLAYRIRRMRGEC